MKITQHSLLKDWEIDDNEREVIQKSKLAFNSSVKKKEEEEEEEAEKN